MEYQIVTAPENRFAYRSRPNASYVWEYSMSFTTLEQAKTALESRKAIDTFVPEVVEL